MTNDLQFFLKGTRLDALQADLRLIDQQLKQTKVLVAPKEQVWLPSIFVLTYLKAMLELKEEAKEWRRKLEQIQKNLDIEQELKENERMLAWSKIEEKENVCRSFRLIVVSSLPRRLNVTDVIWRDNKEGSRAIVKVLTNSRYTSR